MTRVTSHRSATPAHITGHSSRTLFVREDLCRDVHVTSNFQLRNNVRLLLNVELHVRLLNVELRQNVI